MRFRVCLCGKGIACPLKNVDEIQFLITQFRSETRDFQIKWDADQNVALERRVPFVMKIRFDTAENELSQFFFCWRTARGISKFDNKILRISKSICWKNDFVGHEVS